MAIRNIINKYLRFLRVGSFLGIRQIRRGSIWINLLIISIMTLTFLSLVVIPGILIGLTQGSFEQNREHLTGDLYLTTLPEEETIVNTQDIVRVLDMLPEVENYSVRYRIGTTVEAGYINRPDFTDDAESLSVSAFAINPEKEEATISLSKFIVEGEMLESGKSGEVLIGATLLKKYSNFADLFEPLVDVEVGKPIKLTLQGRALEGLERDRALLDGDIRVGQTSEFIVKGIVDSKVGELSGSIFMTEQDYRRISGKQSLQAAEIAIKHVDSISDEQFKNIALSYGLGEYAKVRTADEAIPKFLADVQKTFGLLGNMIGAIGIVVSSITIFIVIYINALTRRKFIGILKGIGISEGAIEFAYMLQSIFYAFIGIGFGLVLLYGVFVPFFAANPIDFPFSDGILVAKIGPTMVRAGVLLIVTMIAGLMPARIIVRQNTLDSILQR
ncbi:MAG: ABC-type lipoprotein release transport system permease subunit [Crocinitomicaceae bacterium]|jgi:ABC-type lipoprotein release transport system permease subunit